ncbi:MULTISPECIES: thymidylate synthase [unclassified Ensifer]|uniref:thymidylate synthase n=1 Tax=unclassified Ensifer TaxID=2633371 RepID=UPI0008137A01|nr:MULTISPECIES: thymidylate synthase [unclassified Ensifer]OCP17654.1 thymidylate synthase [Ensifer sp. LC54]OCP28439.1 thymidylate synthase [Ensifer sp. LC384]
MRHPETQYLDLMAHLLEQGDKRTDRTGVGTLSSFGAMMRFDLSDGSFPILTTKRVYWKLAIKEMLWFLTGQTNIRPLLQENVRIWTDWPLKKYREATGSDISQADFEVRIVADENFAREWGDLGPVYGKQWRRWADANGTEHDQIAEVIATLRTNPTSRRMLFHAWNVPELPEMALPPCHMVYQFHVSGPRNGGQDGADPRSRLNLLVYQRSCDVLLGLPFNLVGGAALLAMVAQQVGMDMGELVWVGGDVHLYLNHVEQAKQQLKRSPTQLPRLSLSRQPASLDEYHIDDFVVSGYEPHPAIQADVAV